jgi:DNA-binding response OmpR family regulator
MRYDKIIPMKILLIEDDKYIAEFIKKGLKEELFVVTHARDGEEGVDCAFYEDHDLIVLDIMLPKKTGIEVCRELRSRGVETPIVMLTAKNEVKDKVLGLESGADDYITKPFSFDEFLARIHAALRRKKTKIAELVYDKLRVDTISHRVFFDETEVILRPKEYAVLKYLFGNKGRVINRTQILENVWGYDYDPSTNIVDVYIRSLREKLVPLFKKDIIRTVRGMGYMVESD